MIQKYLENVPIEHGSKVSQNEENLAIHAQDWNVKNFQGVQVVSQAHLKSGTKKSSFIVSENNTSDGQPITSQVSLTLPKTLFDTMESKSAEQRVSFVVFRKISLFQHADQSASDANAQTQRKTNSFIIAASVKGMEVKNLTGPVETAYQPLKAGKDKSAECVFWDFKQNKGQGNWSGEDCHYKGIINGLVNCHCNHLTNFAILMVINSL